jgi:hypothetical protein
VVPSKLIRLPGKFRFVGIARRVPSVIAAFIAANQQKDTHLLESVCVNCTLGRRNKSGDDNFVEA